MGGSVGSRCRSVTKKTTMRGIALLVTVVAATASIAAGTFCVAQPTWCALRLGINNSRL